jgi:hypothetical protein
LKGLIILLIRFVREWFIPVIYSEDGRARKSFSYSVQKIMEELNLLVCLEDGCANKISAVSYRIYVSNSSEKMRRERALTRRAFQLCVLDLVLRMFLGLFLGLTYAVVGYISTSAVVKRTAEVMFSRKWRKIFASGNSGSDILGKMALF